MAELEKLSEEKLDLVAGGNNYYGVWVTVRGLETGYLAMRTKPEYDPANEIKGSESYNGQTLQIQGDLTVGGDGRYYIWVYNPRSGRSGWANARYLG